MLWWVVGGVFAALGLASGVAALWEVPYYRVSPGSVWRTEELIAVEGGDRYASEGEIGFTTVSLSDGRISALEYVLGQLDPAVDIKPERDILGDQTPEENRQRNLELMASSQELAAAVAFERLGHDVAIPYGARVLDVYPEFPAAGSLERGDLIVSAEGDPVETWEDLVATLEPFEAGDEVTLEVAPAPDDLDAPVVTDETLADVEIQEVTVELATFDDPDDDLPPRAIMGITGETAVRFDFPFDVTIDAGRVGGPSAGLAFTLAILDVLTPEDLTGGDLVATTGTIHLDGSVGPIGGIQQKVFTARRAGVDLFLVPEVEYEAAAAVAGDLRIEPVADLDDALEALASVGGETQALQGDPDGPD